jgi:hypothetical protein
MIAQRAALLAVCLLACAQGAMAGWSVTLSFAPDKTIVIDEFEYCFDSCSMAEYAANHGKLVVDNSDGGRSTVALSDVDHVTINRFVTITQRAAKYDATIHLRNGRSLEHVSLSISGIDGKRSGMDYSLRWYADYHEEQARALKRLAISE